MNKEKLKGILKNKLVLVGLGAFIMGGVILGESAPVGIEVATHDTVVKQVEVLKGEKTNLETKTKELETKNKDLQAKVDQAKPFFDMKDEERVEMEKEAKVKEEARLKAEEGKKKAEEQARLDEEKKGFDTGITYDQLARTPDEYKGKKVKFTGKVIQVMQGQGETQLRIAVNGDYDNVIYVAYPDGITEKRILDDDNITIYGLSAGLLTYKSTMGGEITVPQILVSKIDM